MATTIKTEQRILSLETISGPVKLQSEAILSSSGDIINISGQIQADQIGNIGSFNVNNGPEGDLSTNINVVSTNLSVASQAVNELIADLNQMKTI